MKVSTKFLESIKTNKPANELTHSMYKYPARFPPQFPREIISEFTEKDDLILDPFVGSGTTLVESLVHGRDCIGLDINPLATFVSRVKTTLLNQNTKQEILRLVKEIVREINLHRDVERHNWWCENGYQKDLPWNIRKSLEQFLSEVNKLSENKKKRFLRCIALKSGKWALDCTEEIPSADEFREHLRETASNFISSLEDLEEKINETDPQRDPSLEIKSMNAAQISQNSLLDDYDKKPSIVITSPPYPGVHVLYHRWQIKGRRETPAPYWIINSPDGNGLSHYTLGGRSEAGIDNYFQNITEIYSSIYDVLRSKSFVFQLVSFSEEDDQLERFLTSMNNAGFREVELENKEINVEGRIKRSVPLRKWYASMRSNLTTSQEFLLLHQKV